MNMLGKREPEIYGTRTLDEMNLDIKKEAMKFGVEVEFFQSNFEGEVAEAIQNAKDKGYDAIVINPGAFTHYSYGIRDAIKGAGIPAVEVHMSNVHQREEFRSKSVIAPVCVGQVCGFGFKSYLMGIYYLGISE